MVMKIAQVKYLMIKSDRFMTMRFFIKALGIIHNGLQANA